MIKEGFMSYEMISSVGFLVTFGVMFGLELIAGIVCMCIFIPRAKRRRRAAAAAAAKQAEQPQQTDKQ